MLSKLFYVITGIGVGGAGHYTYKKIQPEKHVQHSKREIIQAYMMKKQIEKGYLLNVLKAIGFSLKGYYHFGMGTKLQGFNFHETYLRSEEVRDDDKQIQHLYCIFSPTDNICGHPEIQHGGATATIIDQNMGQLAILNSKQMVATAQLSVKYKKPIRKDQFYVLQAQVVKREGRKIYVEGIIKDLQTGQIKAQTQGLFMTVNWNNQMTRILTKFFQAINYKDYANEKHTKLNPKDKPQQKKHFEHHSVHVHSIQSKIDELQRIVHKIQEKQKLLKDAYEKKNENKKDSVI